jgi:nitrate/nitrite transporter NarK
VTVTTSRPGHTRSLIASFLLDVCFMLWVLLGALGVSAVSIRLNAAQKREN